MDTALMLTPASSGPLDPSTATARLVDAFLAGRSPETVRAYGRDLADFAAFLDAPDAGAAAARLLAGGQGQANATVLSYRAAMLQRGLSPATVNRRLAAVRSLVALGRTLSMVPWELSVPGVRSEAYRDTAGPGRRGMRRLLERAAARTDPKGVRDYAILRLLHDLALRRAEVARLDIADVDLEAGVLLVLGKGKREKGRLTLPEPTAEALAAWLAVRPASAGEGSPPPPDAPLFVSFDRARKGSGRLTGKAIYQTVRALGNTVGLQVWPHAIRHRGITAALDAAKGDIRAAQRFSRHANMATLLKYDDNRTDLGGALARKVAAGAR
jgi:integrase/recombinase XerC